MLLADQVVAPLVGGAAGGGGAGGGGGAIGALASALCQAAIADLSLATMLERWSSLSVVCASV